jgi:preprotein translocase subunit SecE
MKTYIVEAYKELTQKATWPTWKSLQSSGILVMIASAIFSVVVLAMDLGFKNILKAVYDILYEVSR